MAIDSMNDKPLLKFPGGTYHVSSQENARLCEAVGTEPDSDRRAHPIFYYIAGQCGMGISVADLCAAYGFDVNDGPMMVKSGVEFTGELLVDEEYKVSGGVTSIVRKPSRTFGAVDQLIFELFLADCSGDLVLKSTNTWILPRREVA